MVQGERVGGYGRSQGGGGVLRVVGNLWKEDLMSGPEKWGRSFEWSQGGHMSGHSLCTLHTKLQILHSEF